MTKVFTQQQAEKMYKALEEIFKYDVNNLTQCGWTPSNAYFMVQGIAQDILEEIDREEVVNKMSKTEKTKMDICTSELHLAHTTYYQVSEEGYTFHCQRPKGHSGEHKDTGWKGDISYTITWENQFEEEQEIDWWSDR